MGCRDVWEISALRGNSLEKSGYPTQKLLKLLERIIQASSREGDVVLDPFCGCATACVAAEKLKRKWIGIDISQKAFEIVKNRLNKEVNGEGILYQDLVTFLTDAPKRTDIGTDYREKKWVYVISNPKMSGEYKVGVAKNWKSRLNSYQTADSDRSYKIEFKLLTPHFNALERHVHTSFNSRHEWVEGNLEEVIKVMKNFIFDSNN